MAGEIKKRRKKRPPSYAWARHAEVSPYYRQLSDAAEEGLAYATRLTEDAAFRAERALRGELLSPLSLNELAEQEGISVQAVSACIRQARRQLFGGLSDSGIYYRAARQSELSSRPARQCAAPHCERLLPRLASRARTYCDGACRVRACRARQRQKRDSLSSVSPY
jgi:predicted DNA-binding protein YlxM (UPF0122 family)